MSYNLSWMNTSNTLPDVISNVNTTSGGVFIGVFMIILWVALFSLFKNYETIVAFIGSSFVVSLVAGLLWFIDFLPWFLAVIPLVMLLAGLIINGFRE